MSHDDAVVFFHEFGHLMHALIGGAQTWARFSGVATERDFIEAPSQLLEEWAWNPGVLQTFAVNAAEESRSRPTWSGGCNGQRRQAGQDKTRANIFGAAVSHRGVLRPA